MIDPNRALNIVKHSHELAFDTETTGLTVRDKPCGYVITNREHSIYVPVRHSGGGNIPDGGGFERELNLAFDHRARCGFRTIGHNLGFDLRMCNRMGVYPRYPLEDTMINEALIDDRTIGYGLDDCCGRHKVSMKSGAPLYKALAEKFGGLPDRKQMKHFSKLPGDHPEVVGYATQDGVSTLELQLSQSAYIRDEELEKVWQLECRLIEYVAKIHERGLRIDMEYASQIGTIIEAEIKRLNRQFSKGFNVRSPKDVEALYRANGYTDDMFARTDQGKPSFKEDWLEDNNIGQAILNVRRMEKARDSFVKPLVETENVNGRVHPVLNQSKSDDYGVAGARFSCSEPNLQAFPKRNEDVGRLVRRLIIADEGMELAEADFKQQEPCLFAHYSQDPRLLEGYTNGTMDIHDIAAQDFGRPRNSAKRLAMGILTGMQPKALSGHMGYSIEEAIADHRKFLTDSFPKVGEFQQKAKAVFQQRGYVKSILGRRARLDHPRFAYRGISRIIQNSGGDHCKYSLLKACQYEDAHPEVQILLTIHDSIMWQKQEGYDDTELERTLAGTATEMGISVPIRIDVGRGKDWATVSYGE